MPDGQDRSYIAQLTLPALTSEGRRETVYVAIGAPVEGDALEWQCPIRIQGLGQQWDGAISAVDSVQALCLAMSLVSQSLRTMLDGGNRLLMPNDPADPDDDDLDWPIEAYFGPHGHGQRGDAR